jgi:hypothetical protein
MHIEVGVLAASEIASINSVAVVAPAVQARGLWHRLVEPVTALFAARVPLAAHALWRCDRPSLAGNAVRAEGQCCTLASTLAEAFTGYRASAA